MNETTFTFPTDDGESVFVYRWEGEGDPKAIVQIAHGMGEHAARYCRLAGDLVDRGYVVYADDHRGHGHTAGSADRQGHLGPNGWNGLVDDVATLSGLARKERPGIPLVLIGHSMGSFALQQLILDRSDIMDGAVLSGSTAVDVVAGALDPTQPADLTSFNAPFEPARTEFDWLSRDTDEVDLYVADPMCGFGLDAEGTGAMLAGAPALGDPDRLTAIRPDLPIYVISGEADPLSGAGALTQLVVDRYRAAGVTEVSVDIYAGCRHELFNETNRDEVTANLVAWLDRVVA